MTDATRSATPAACQEAVDTETALPGRRERRVRRVPAPRHTRLQPPRRRRRHRGHHRHGAPRRPPRGRDPPGHHRTPRIRLLLGRHRHAARHHPPGSPATLGRHPCPCHGPCQHPRQRWLPVTRSRPCAGSRTRNPQGSGRGGEHRPSRVLRRDASPRLARPAGAAVRLRPAAAPLPRTLPRAAALGAGLRRVHRTVPLRHLGPRTDPGLYAARVRRYRDQIGRLAWAAPQDWMCEPAILASDRPDRRRAPAPAPSPTTCACATWPRTCRSSRSCRAGPPATTCAASTRYAAAGVDLAAEAGRGRLGVPPPVHRRARGHPHRLHRRGSPGCTASASRSRGWPAGGTCSPRPTPWPGAAPAAGHPCPAARTAVAPTACATP